jgi:hypothetical protein
MDRILDLVAMNSAQTIHAFLHVFGSVSGYTTLGCDPGISAADRHALELLGFGQTDDPEYLASLASLPAGIGRPLPSGRYALTRCFLGPPDSAGRTTLRFVSLVFESQDWVQCVSLGVWSVLTSSAVWSWTDSSSPTTARVTVTPSSIDPEYKNDLLNMLNGWIHARTARSVCACRDSDQSRQFVAGMPCLLPPSDRAGFRWGVGLLAPGSVADICTLAPTAETSSRRPVVWLPSSQLGTAPYASALSHFWPRGAPLPAHFVSNTASSLSFANAVVDDDSASLPATAAHSSRTRSLILASIAVALGVGVPLVIFLGFFRGGPSATAVADPIANTAGDPSATPAAPATPAPDATDPVKELATNVEHPTKASDSTSQEPPAPATDARLEAPKSSPTPKEPGLPDQRQDHPSSIAPIESISITPAPARPADATPSDQGVEPDPDWPPETLSRDALLARLDEAADAATELDRLSSSATEPATAKFASIEELLRWHYIKENIKRYNNLQREANDRDRKLIEENGSFRQKISIINSVTERSSEYHARQLINEYRLDEATKQKMNLDSPEFRKLQLESDRLFKIYPKGIYVNNVHQSVERIRKRK